MRKRARNVLWAACIGVGLWLLSADRMIEAGILIFASALAYAIVEGREPKPEKPE